MTAMERLGALEECCARQESRLAALEFLIALLTMPCDTLPGEHPLAPDGAGLVPN